MFRGSTLQRGLLLSTKVRCKQVVASESDKGSLLLTDTAFNQGFDRARQVIVAQPMRHACKVLKGTDMSVEEGFLLDFLGKP